jgi:hypothetical protein
MIDKFFLIVLFHVIFVAPLLLWVGFARAATPAWVYNVLFVLGIIVLLYHSYKAVIRFSSNSVFLWVNLIHIGLIAPLLLWVGYHGKKTDAPAYNMLLLVAFAALGYHTYKILVLTEALGKEEH